MVEFESTSGSTDYSHADSRDDIDTDNCGGNVKRLPMLPLQILTELD